MYGRAVTSPPLRVDRVDVHETGDELTLILGVTGVHVMMIRLRYDGWIDEVINSAGTVARGPSAWTLINHDLSLELGRPSATALGFPRDCRLHLDVDEPAIRLARTALLEILDCACYIVDTIDGRVVS